MFVVVLCQWVHAYCATVDRADAHVAGELVFVLCNQAPVWELYKLRALHILSADLVSAEFKPQVLIRLI